MADGFQGVDFYDVDSLLSEDERMIRAAVRDWVDEQVLPVIQEAYVEGRFPAHLIPQMGELGMLGANLPEEYGCAGLNNVAYGLIMQELAGRLRRPVSRLGAGRTRHVSDLDLWKQRTEGELAAPAGVGRENRVLRADRARLRIESRWNGNEGKENR